jgi:DNA-binding PadR family transcriptional regulator
MVIKNLTKLILLGILSEFPKPIHGYEIKKVINQWAIGEFAEISFGSIYYNLEKMEKEGLLSSRKEKVSERPERTLYHITKIGKTKLIEMVRKNFFEIQSIRYPLDVGLLFMPILSKSEIIEAFDKRIQYIQKSNKEHKGLVEMLKEKIPFFAIYIIKHHYAHLDAELKWLQELKEEVENREVIEDFL